MIHFTHNEPFCACYTHFEKYQTLKHAFMRAFFMLKTHGGVEMKSPDSWAVIVESLKNIFQNNSYSAAGAAFIMSLLQAFYKTPDTSCIKKVVNATICSFLCVPIIPAAEKFASSISYFEGTNIGLFLGVFVGYIGSDKIREWVINIVENKNGKK